MRGDEENEKVNAAGVHYLLSTILFLSIFIFIFIVVLIFVLIFDFRFNFCFNYYSDDVDDIKII